MCVCLIWGMLTAQFRLLRGPSTIAAERSGERRDALENYVFPGWELFWVEIYASCAVAVVGG